MTTFLHRASNAESNYSVVLEDDGKVAYAYLLDKDEIVSDVWLYNQQQTPEQPEWTEKSRMPFLNPRIYAKSVYFAPLTDERDVKITWNRAPNGEIESAELHLRGQRFAMLAPGEKPGSSLLAAKDGPLAKVLVG